MTSLMQSVDNRTQLAGTNRLEVLLFSLGKDQENNRDEVFGINVFKVREVMHIPEITRVPNMPEGVEGMVSLRGVMVPVVNLAKFCGVKTDQENGILMVTEYNKHVQGFLVHSVDVIQRLDWEEVKAPPGMMSNRLGGLVTAVAELSDERLAIILDVEKVLAETAGFYDDEEIFAGINAKENNKKVTVLFADDSSVARSQIIQTLDHMGVKHIGTTNGVEAWDRLSELADKAEQSGFSASDQVQIILTDVEMPEMDGYVLTRKVKDDVRFKDIPVVMHTSLTSEANQALGKSVGANTYVSKFEPKELSTVLQKIIDEDDSIGGLTHIDDVEIVEG